MIREEDDYDDDSDYSESSTSTLESDDFEEEVDCCVSDMTGNRLLPMDKLLGVFRNSVCCRRCAVSNHTKEMKRFMSFTKEYEEKVLNEERNTLFHSRLERLEWKLRKNKSTSELFEMFNGGQVTTVEDRICCNFVICEETYGIATALCGT